MGDFYEIDFLPVETAKSGDAIALRYEIDGDESIHVVDGGFTSTGESLVKHIREYYDDPTTINRVVVTHPDGDHACGVRSVLEEFEVDELWMLRPWEYADDLVARFRGYASSEGLATRLKEDYPYVAELESIAIEKGISIHEPFQGARVGSFTVLAPTRARYLDLIVDSEKTPEPALTLARAMRAVSKAVTGTVSMVRAAWGEESLSSEPTSAENEMSVVQFARLCNHTIVLTADVGRDGLAEAANFAPIAGLTLPGVVRFQVPHHGSRRNVSSELLDRWLGKKLESQLDAGQGTFSAIISSAKEDEDHPRNAVVRAMIHRGAKVLTTEGGCICAFMNAPERGGTWGPAPGVEYPNVQEA